MAACAIDHLIGASASVIDSGARLVGQASRIKREIAAASGDQQAGFADVNAALAQIDRATEQNAAPARTGGGRATATATAGDSVAAAPRCLYH